ncbi:hypothetical protein YC2023_115151 [Brassica napus]
MKHHVLRLITFGWRHSTIIDVEPTIQTIKGLKSLQMQFLESMKHEKGKNMMCRWFKGVVTGDDRQDCRRS